MPVLERVYGHAPVQHGLRELAVVEADVAHEGLFETISAAEAMALQDVLDLAVEALHHAIRLQPHRRGETMLYPECDSKAGELVRAGGRAAAEAEETQKI
jgi:hypothetical protein